MSAVSVFFSVDLPEEALRHREHAAAHRVVSAVLLAGAADRDVGAQLEVLLLHDVIPAAGHRREEVHDEHAVRLRVVDEVEGEVECARVRVAARDQESRAQRAL
jgi:hypothetical protein